MKENKDDLFNHEDRPASVICSAIHIDDTVWHDYQPINIKSGYIIAGRRHHNCFKTASILSDGDYSKYKKHKIEQGFLTSDNRFLNRIEAMELAIGMNQTREGCELGKPLFSEDLY